MTTGESGPGKLVETYFAAMRRGADAEADLMALFHPDAVYEEPFSGSAPAVGHDAIRERFRAGWEFPLPDLELDVLAMEVAADAAQSKWECRSPALSQPMRGEDRYEFEDGLIVRLEVRITDD